MPAEKAEKTELKKRVVKSIQKECSTCKWWMRAFPRPEDAEKWGRQYFDFGECRGKPPSALGGVKTIVAPNDGELTTGIKTAAFPHTYHNDWCGVWAKSVALKEHSANDG